MNDSSAAQDLRKRADAAHKRGSKELADDLHEAARREEAKSAAQGRDDFAGSAGPREHVLDPNAKSYAPSAAQDRHERFLQDAQDNIEALCDRVYELEDALAACARSARIHGCPYDALALQEARRLLGEGGT